VRSIVLDPVESAIEAYAAGRAVVVVDDEDRENEGDLIAPAGMLTPELTAFFVRHTSGYLCVALEQDAARRLQLPPMARENQDPRRTAYTVTVDASAGITTGISARDRAHTIRLLADPSTRASDLSRPGHVVPLIARPGGVLERQGHTEAAVDLAKAAGLAPAGVLCEIVSELDPTGMARGPELREFSDRHGLPMISIADLVAHRTALAAAAADAADEEVTVERVADARLPLAAGMFRAVGYRSVVDGREHVALVMGDVTDAADVLTRVHSECLTGDVLGSQRCDCGPQLEESLRAVARQGRGVVVYLRGHEGRGIGLLGKIAAYELQDAGLDTVEANLRLGYPVDARDFAIGARILADLRVRSVHLLTNNPAKRAGLESAGLVVHRTVPLPSAVTAHNQHYLRTKRERMGHDLRVVDGGADELAS
jgi:3,4-dihydroxy 2-butanone 4-phosphate synthase/GTP cyclohydrolase II